MEKLDLLMKTLDEVKKGIVNDQELDEEEQLIKQRNQELMDRFNAINESVKVDDKLNQATPVDIQVKSQLQQSSHTGEKLEQLERDFSSIFAKMGELFFASGQPSLDDQENKDGEVNLEGEKLNQDDKEQKE